MRKFPLVVAGVAVVIMGGCSSPSTSIATGCSNSTVGKDDYVILASATRNEPRPTLSPRDEEKLIKAADSTASVYIYDLAGSSPTCLQLTPRRANGQVEHSAGGRARKIADNMAIIRTKLSEVKSDSGNFDLLELMSGAARLSKVPSNLIIVSSGVTTSGGMDLRNIGWTSEPTKVVDQLRVKQLVPNLKDWKVTYSGLGIVSGEQKELLQPQRLALESYWKATCLSSGATVCDVNDEPRTIASALSTTPVPSVYIPEITSVEGAGVTTTTVPIDMLGFAPDSSSLGSSADKVLQPLADQAKRDNRKVSIRGYSVAIHGQNNTAILSLQRAQAVANKLVTLGLPRTQIIKVTGENPSEGAYVNGQFNEEKASQLRHVVITQTN